MSSSYSDYDSTGSDTDVPNDHVLEIDLDSLEAKNLVRRAAFSNLHSSGVRPAYEQYTITASVLSLPDKKEGEEPMIRIITRTNDSERATGDERWLHLGTECISFQEFKRYAANVALEHHADSLPVVMYLLDHVQDHHEQLSAYGSYIEPGTVLRCDGMDRHDRHKPDHSVTFVSIPYFDVSHGSPFEPPEDVSLHLTRSLFQHFYPHEVAKDRDDSQQFKKFRQTRGGEYLRVPQLWILIVDSSTIVTCGPTSLKEMAQAWLEIIPEVSLASTTQKLVQITDTRKRTTVLTPEQCGSYLELKQKIQDECLFDTKDDIDQCTIHVGDSEVMLDPSHWPSLLRDTQSALINLVIRRRITADTPPDDTLKFLDAPETRMMIEYTDLGSDDDSTSGRELILYSGSYRSPPKYPVPSGTKVESQKRLKAAGSVGIKDEALQQNDSAFFQGKQPKIFRRPTVAEDESSDGHTSVSSSSNARSENGSTSESHTGDSENDGSGSPIGAKHVRFRDAQSDEQWVTNSSASSRSVRTRDFDYISDGSEENTVAGAADSVSESSSTNYTTLVASNSALIKWTDPLRGIREAALESISKTVNEPYQARVDDYESSISSDGGSSLADEVEIFPLEPNGMRSRTSSLSQSGRLRDDEQVTGEGTHLGGSGTSVHDDDPSGPEDASTQSAPEEQTKPLTEHELRKVIQDVIGTTLRDNESQLEETMRTRLRKFGFQDNQIEAMISPGNEQPAGSTPNNPIRIPAQPTYPRIRRENLDVETLHYYDIPYEYDMNPDYLIILREMSRKEVDILFEHTRRLRSLSSEPIASSKTAHHGREKKEYAFVRRKSRSRRGEDAPRSGHATAHLDAKMRERSTEYTSRKFNTDLSVPPFLAWPTTIEEREVRNAAERGSKDEGLRIKLTLHAIKTRIYQADDGQDIRKQSSNLFVYRSGGIFVEVPKSSCPKRLFRHVQAPAMSTTDTRPGESTTDLQKELSYLRAKFASTGKDLPAGKVVATASSAVQGNGHPRRSDRQVLSWQMASIQLRGEALVSALQELIKQFVPEFFDHTLVQRCWGSVETIMKVLERERKRNLELRELATTRSATYYVVKEVPGTDYVDFHEIKQLLTTPIEQCQLCRSRHRYSNTDDAVSHLRQVHMRPRNESGSPSESSLRHWLVSPSAQNMEQSNERLLEFIEVLLRCTQKLLSNAIEMRSSVADKDNQKSRKYLLPTALVKAAEKIFQFIYYCAYSMLEWEKRGSIPLASRDLPVLLPDQMEVTGAEYFAKIADTALSNSRDELMLMAHTGQSRSALLYIRTTPESNVLVSLIFLLARPILGDLHVTQLYRHHLARLRYEGSQKPTKRILREVYLWKDELEIVEAVLEQQIETINAIKTVLNPDSFRITNQARIKAYRILEQPFAIQVKEQFEKVIRKELQALYKEADKLAESLRHNIDIAEEGNSKAILIFTLVTIIFLPLSFVSSVFGMNTIDVRDMESTQTLFWAVALPVTAVVGGLSMLAAYGGPTLHRYYKALKKVRLEIHPALKRPVRPNDEEKIIIAENDDAPEARTVRGRRRRSYIQVARGDRTRRSRARIPSPSPPPLPLRKPTQEGRNVTLGDMLFR